MDNFNCTGEARRATHMAEIKQAVEVLRGGGLVAFPTETVYGLGADATQAAAVERIYRVKGRPATNPVIVHVADIERAKRYAADWPEAAQKLADRFWPGPLTLVLPKSPQIVDQVTAGLGTVGLRVPNHPLALELLRAFDGAVGAPSANRSMRISPTTADHVREELGEDVQLILDGGPCEVGIESTVLDLSGDQPCVLRPGMVTRSMIEQVIGPVATGKPLGDTRQPALSPGQQLTHYAPRTPAFRFNAPQAVRISTDGAGLIDIAAIDQPRFNDTTITLPADPEQYARHFYAVLRQLDRMDLKAIFVEMPPDSPAWTPVRDRIRRATRPMA